MKHIYIDINIFGKESEFIGYGALVCNDKIPAIAVSEAMEGLKNDPDINNPRAKELDISTVKRSYFHASKDSQNAHSHLCISLNKNIQGLYRAEIFDRYISRSNTEKAYQLIYNIYRLKVLDLRENIAVVFEQSNNLKLEYLESAFKRLYRELLASSFNNPVQPIFFPKINFVTKKKDEPGLQFIDFLLWATQRKFNGRDDWYNRINAENISESKNEYNIWNGVNFEINYSPSAVTSYYDKDNINVDISNLTEEALIKSFFDSVKIVSYYAENPLPQYLNHIKEDLLYIHNNRKDLQAYGYVKKLAKAFLTLFDMVPLIKETSSLNEKISLLSIRKHMSAILNNENINGEKAANFLGKIRKQYIDTQPELFD